MTWESFSLDAYLNRELRYWKSLKAVLINKKGKNKVLQAVRKRFDDTKVLTLAEKRFESMASIISLFKPTYRNLITERVNKELGANLGDALDLQEIKRWAKGRPDPRATVAFWIEVAVVVVIIIIVIVAEQNDNNGVGEDDTVIVTVGTATLAKLVDENKYLDCEEILTLNYNTWATYLLMVQATDNTGSQYLKALICAPCPNLTTLVESFNHDHELILPDGITWLGAFLYVARLEECGIPY